VRVRFPAVNLQTATFLIAVLGLLLGALSLGWQLASFILTGGRVKAELRPGGVSGRMIITIPARTVTRDSAKQLMSQGVTQLVVAVQVRNVGRLPVTITSWSLITVPGGVTAQPVASSIGPALPHRLAAGETETWAMDRGELLGFLAATATMLTIPVERMRIRAEVGLGTGQTVRAKGSL